MKTFAEICPMWDNAIKTKGLSPDYVINKESGEILSHEDVSKRDLKDRGFRITEYDFLEIIRPKYCIIGEAYGFSDLYCKIHENDEKLCVHCSMLGNEFCDAIKKSDYEIFEILKKDFVDHWNEKHDHS